MNYHLLSQNAPELHLSEDTNHVFFTTDRTIGRDANAIFHALGLEDMDAACRFARPHQTHSDHVFHITPDFFSLTEEERKATLEGIDAVISDVKDVCLGISTADCIPVLIYDKEHHAAAAIHAGWRGTLQRIVEKTIHTMQNTFGTCPESCKAVIGPGISQESFEVGWEVHQQFLDAGFPMDNVTIVLPSNDGNGTKPHLDIKEINRQQMLSSGIKAENIFLSDIDTFTNEQYFSARREQKGPEKCGRLLSGFILRTLLLLFLLLPAFALRGASPSVPSTSSSVPYSIRFYDDSDGMSQWHATKILQDKTGMIWFSTWNGLSRFDGINFSCFKVQPGDGNNVTNDRIRDFILDSDGTFLCHVDEDIFRFDTRSCRFSNVDKDIKEKTLKIMEQERLSPNGTPHSLSLGNETLNNVHHEITDKQGNVWAIGNAGIYKAVPLINPYKRIAEVEHSDVKAMFCDAKGRIWICSKSAVGDATVAVFNKDLSLIGYLGKDGTLHPSPTPFSPIYSIFQDSKGTIWLGSKPDGLFRLTESNGHFAIRNFRSTDATPSRLAHDAVYDIIEDANGCLWVATLGGGICYIENPNSPVPHFVDLKKTLGDAYPKECIKVRHLLLHDKNTLLATSTLGFLVIKGIEKRGKNLTITRHAREANRASSLSCSATMDVFVDARGYIVITTESGGLNITDSKSLSNKSIDFRHVTTHDGLGSDAAYSIRAIDKNRRIIQCNNQLALTTSYNDFLCYSRVFFKTRLLFSDAAPLVLDKDRMLIAMENGVIVLSTKDLERKAFMPHIALTSISLPNDSTLWAVDHLDTLRLNPDQRNVTIRFAALDYSAMEKKLYSTSFTENGFLEKLTFSEPTTSNEVSLYDLKPGTYTLAIRSTDSNGILNENDCRLLTIIVEPRFVETAFAKFLFFLFIIAAIAGITYTIIYIRNINRQRRETLEAYLALLKDDMGTQQPQSSPASDAEIQSNAPAITQEESHATIINPQLSPADEAFMNRLVQFVENNIGNSEVGVDNIADATAMSRSSLSRKMKQLLGVTPADFLKEARIKRASHLLTSTTLSTADIAFSCGFSDPKYFSKCFKASTGKTPKEFRECDKKE